MTRLRGTVAACIGVVGIMAGGPALAQPRENEVRVALATMLGRAYIVEQFQFKNFHGDDPSIGRTSVLGTLRTNEPMFMPESSEYAILEGDLENRNIDQEVRDLEDLVRQDFGIRVGDPYVMIAPTGASVPFTAELSYQEQVVGFAFGGKPEIDTAGLPASKLPRDAVQYGTESYERLLQAFEQVHAKYFASFPSEAAETARFLSGELEIFHDGVLLGTTRPVDVGSMDIDGSDGFPVVVFDAAFVPAMSFKLGRLGQYDLGVPVDIGIRLSRGRYLVPELDVSVPDPHSGGRWILSTASWDGMAFVEEEDGYRVVVLGAPADEAGDAAPEAGIKLVANERHAVFARRNGDHIEFRLEARQSLVDRLEGAYPDKDFAGLTFDVDQNGRRDSEVDTGYGASGGRICTFYLLEVDVTTTCGGLPSAARLDVRFEPSAIENRAHPIWIYSIPSREIEQNGQFNVNIRIHEADAGFTWYPKGPEGTNLPTLDVRLD